ncbi:MAG: glycerol-3-phosphate acyltransferase [Bacteroidota bacterium]
MIFYLYSSIFGYLIGSFPTAYVLLKWRRGVDVRKLGSGNVGAMNMVDITGSAWLGALTMFIDVFKGVMAVTLCRLWISEDTSVISAAGLASVIGHNYSIWLKGKGGRGIATAAGVIAVLGWAFIAIWAILWIVGYVPTKNIHTANIVATILSPVVMAFVPSAYFQSVIPGYTEINHFMIVVSLLMGLILVRHSDQFHNAWKSIHI